MRARLGTSALVLLGAFALSACEVALGLGDLHGTTASGTGASSTSSSSGGDAGSDATATMCGQPGSVSSLWHTLVGATPGPAWATGDQGGTATEMDGSVMLAVPNANAEAEYEALSLVSLIGCSISIEITPQPDAGGIAYLAVADMTGGNVAAIAIDGTEIKYQLAVTTCTDGGPCDPSMSAPYDAKLDQYVRFAETAGKLSFETSPNGTAWTTQLTVDTPDWASNAAVVFGVRIDPQLMPVGSTSAQFANVGE